MNQNVKPKRSILGKLLCLILIAIGCSVIFAAFVPTIISSSWGKTKLVSWINQSIPGTTTLDTLSLTWRGPQQIKGVALVDSEGVPVLSLEQINVDASLFDLVRQSSLATALEWKGLNIHLVGDSEGNTNLIKALDKSCCTTSTHVIHPVVVDLKNTDGKISLADTCPSLCK